jgi:hypothetical protein
MKFEIEVSLDGKTWGPAVAKSVGTAPLGYVQFEPVWARYLRIVQTGEDTEGRHWSIRRLEILEPSPLHP